MSKSVRSWNSKHNNSKLAWMNFVTRDDNINSKSKSWMYFTFSMKIVEPAVHSVQ